MPEFSCAFGSHHHQYFITRTCVSICTSCNRVPLNAIACISSSCFHDNAYFAVEIGPDLPHRNRSTRIGGPDAGISGYDAGTVALAIGIFGHDAGMTSCAAVMASCVACPRQKKISARPRSPLKVAYWHPDCCNLTYTPATTIA